MFRFRGQSIAKWSGLACLSIWLVLMLMIWAFLAGWTAFGVFVLFAALQLAACV